jgi:hypothetical protein
VESTVAILSAAFPPPPLKNDALNYCKKDEQSIGKRIQRQKAKESADQRDSEYSNRYVYREEDQSSARALQNFPNGDTEQAQLESQTSRAD